MNSKLDKYFNHVVDSFIRGIEIDYEEDMARFPHGTDFSFFQIYSDGYFPEAFFYADSSLSQYLKDNFGIGDGESVIIWDRAIQKLRKVIWDKRKNYPYPVNVGKCYPYRKMTAPFLRNVNSNPQPLLFQ